MDLNLTSVEIRKKVNLTGEVLIEKAYKYYFDGKYEGETLKFVYYEKDGWETFRINENCKLNLKDNFVYFRYIYSFGYDDYMEDFITVNGVDNDGLLNYLEANCDDNEETFLSMIFGIPFDKRENMSDFVNHIENEYKSKLVGPSSLFAKYVKENDFYVKTKQLIKEYNENH